MRRLHKKADLSLSINAIVVLILAITMLGLGLGFTKGMFGKLSGKLQVEPPNIPATSEEQIVLPSDTIQLDKNRDAEFSVNFYNDFSGAVVTPSLSCVSPFVLSTAGVAGGDEKVVAAPQTVPAGQYRAFKFIIPSGALTEPNVGNGICTLKFTVATDPVTEVEKQVVVKVR